MKYLSLTSISFLLLACSIQPRDELNKDYETLHGKWYLAKVETSSKTNTYGKMDTYLEMLVNSTNKTITFIYYDFTTIIPTEIKLFYNFYLEKGNNQEKYIFLQNQENSSDKTSYLYSFLNQSSLKWTKNNTNLVFYKY